MVKIFDSYIFYHLHKKTTSKYIHITYVLCDESIFDKNATMKSLTKNKKQKNLNKYMRKYPNKNKRKNPNRKKSPNQMKEKN